MEISVWVILGFIVGTLSTFFLVREGKRNYLLDLSLGIFGAVVGGFLMNILGTGDIAIYERLGLFELIVAVMVAGTFVWVGHKRLMRVR